jgi:WhiB family redox-sensing transcriptional regulator
MTDNDDKDIELSDLVASVRWLAWRERAACTGKQEIFFNDHKIRAVAEAKAICGTCPVKAECLDHALTHTEFGLWGGMTANERRMYRRAERKRRRDLGLAGE